MVAGSDLGSNHRLLANICDRLRNLGQDRLLAVQSFRLLPHTLASTPALSFSLNLFLIFDSAILVAPSTVKVPLAIDSTSSSGSYSIFEIPSAHTLDVNQDSDVLSCVS